jgi:hypothetical protein
VPGLAADIVAAPANPLDDIETLRKINFVVKDGKIVRWPQDRCAYCHLHSRRGLRRPSPIRLPRGFIVGFLDLCLPRSTNVQTAFEEMRAQETFDGASLPRTGESLSAQIAPCICSATIPILDHWRITDR